MPDPLCAQSKSVLLLTVLTASLVGLVSPQSILAPSPAATDGKAPSTAKATGDIDGFFNWPVGGDTGAVTRHESEEKSKRGYKAEGDAYIRFGKRSQEQEESLVQYDVSGKSSICGLLSLVWPPRTNTDIPCISPSLHSLSCPLL